MAAYIALFRGINVSGKNSVNMPRLQKLFLSQGFTKVETYVQSGNVVFHAEENEENATPHKISARIAKEVEKELAVLVPIVVVKGTILREICSDNPYLKEEHDPKHLHFTFLATANNGEPGWEPPASADAEPLEKLNKLAQSSGEDTFRLSPYGLYLSCPNGYGRSKLTNTALERVLKLVATTRNWNTTTALATKAEAIG